MEWGDFPSVHSSPSQAASSPYSTGLYPLSGPLPRYILTINGIQHKAGQGYCWPWGASWQLVSIIFGHFWPFLAASDHFCHFFAVLAFSIHFSSHLPLVSYVASPKYFINIPVSTYLVKSLVDWIYSSLTVGAISLGKRQVVITACPALAHSIGGCYY